MADSCGDLQLTPITEDEFPVIRALAETIWRQHYTGIISGEQIAYMLAGRFSDDALHDQRQAPDKWLEEAVAEAPLRKPGLDLQGASVF
jgi:hypothetical protein